MDVQPGSDAAQVRRLLGFVARSSMLLHRQSEFLFREFVREALLLVGPPLQADHASRLILLPKRPYKAALSPVISSRYSPSFSSSAAISALIFSTDWLSRSWTSGTGNEKNESPTLYGTLSSSSASSSSVEISSRSSFSFCVAVSRLVPGSSQKMHAYRPPWPSVPPRDPFPGRVIG
jgi:hypothetical protein